MKSSLEMSRAAHSSVQRGTISSVHSSGLRPLAAAALATFTPCSSVPVKKCTDRPCRRRQRAMKSHATVV
jgi:hypothetical protein